MTDFVFVHGSISCQARMIVLDVMFSNEEQTLLQGLFQTRPNRSKSVMSTGPQQLLCPRPGFNLCTISSLLWSIRDLLVFRD